MSRVLVIGGTLFIGQALVRRLLARGDEVTILHRRSGTPFGKRVEEIRCDRNDVAAIHGALAGRSFDLVFDNVYDWQRGTTAEQVAAAATAAATPSASAATSAASAAISKTLRRYVFTSSIGAYGEGLDHHEDDPLAPSDHPIDYIRNKAESERALFRLHRERGLPAATLRPAFVYGPGNPFYREAFFWDRLLADRPILVPGDGSRLMQLTHVEDVAAAAILAAEREVAPGRAYNVASQPPLTQVELVTELARAAGKEASLVHVPRERIAAAGGEVFQPPFYFGEYYDLPSITVRTERLRRELALEPTPHREGFAETFRWYRDSYRHQEDSPRPDFTWEDRLLASL